MNIVRAKEIILALAEGVDPTTGEVLPENSVCNKGEVVRALYTVLSYMEERKTKKELPQNAGKPWTNKDDEELIRCVREGLSRKEICERLARSSGSITSRLAKLGIADL